MHLKKILESGPTSPLIYSGPYLRTAQQKLQKIIFKIAIESKTTFPVSLCTIKPQYSPRFMAGKKVKIETLFREYGFEVEWGLEIED